MRRTNVEHSTKMSAEYRTATFAKRVLCLRAYSLINKFVKMEDIIFVKRSSRSQLRTFKKPVIKLEMKNGLFIVSDIVAKALFVDQNNGLMFGFNQAAKTAFVLKDDEDDAFKLSRKDLHTLRFTSKDLMHFFTDTFDLLEKGKSSFVFIVDLQANAKGLHKVCLA